MGSQPGHFRPRVYLASWRNLYCLPQYANFLVLQQPTEETKYRGSNFGFKFSVVVSAQLRFLFSFYCLYIFSLLYPPLESSALRKSENKKFPPLYKLGFSIASLTTGVPSSSEQALAFQLFQFQFPWPFPVLTNLPSNSNPISFLLTSNPNSTPQKAVLG